ncbi:MAG: hypothetical protein ACRD1B_08915, partial [Thermoanaerobaculia bacterium]
TMASEIGFAETTDVSAVAGDVSDEAVLRLDPTRRCMLRFEIRFSHTDGVEALRYARRVMIREERTHGLEWEEPSMEDPTFAGKEIRWFVLVSQASWCRQKIAELFERANCAHEALQTLGG